jgi:hypothetical protein
MTTDNKLSTVHLEVLKSMYAREERRLSEALIGGASWEAVREQRRTVTDIAAAIHKRLYPTSFFDPASFRLRDNP